ncbi:hypothetical protein EX30DRAFT_393639 [Ascodesmis nigricans]|uniref:Uncharacterized protein n=1 Tax=Ascodesmis nigricans TaxID=341454 RepID=A0A4V3SJI4_9PEZI|nr:hypothetical protein EX30DRAFT_393639 [Ascodesmis nigricans]
MPRLAPRTLTSLPTLSTRTFTTTLPTPAKKIWPIQAERQAKAAAEELLKVRTPPSEELSLRLATSLLQLSRYQLQVIRLFARSHGLLLQSLTGHKVARLKTAKFQEIRMLSASVERFYQELGISRGDRRLETIVGRKIRKYEVNKDPMKRTPQDVVYAMIEEGDEVGDRAERVGEWEKRLDKIEAVLGELEKRGGLAPSAEDVEIGRKRVERERKVRRSGEWLNSDSPGALWEQMGDEVGGELSEEEVAELERLLTEAEEHERAKTVEEVQRERKNMRLRKDVHLHNGAVDVVEEKALSERKSPARKVNSSKESRKSYTQALPIKRISVREYEEPFVRKRWF